MNESKKLVRQPHIPDVTSSEQMDPAKPNYEAKVIKATENVYVAVGFALANMIMIEGKR